MSQLAVKFHNIVFPRIMWSRQKYWLVPIFVTMAVFGFLVVLTQISRSRN